MLDVSICGISLDGLLRCKSFHLRFRLSGPNSKGIFDKGMLCYLTLWTNESILFLVVHLDFDGLLISQRI